MREKERERGVGRKTSGARFKSTLTSEHMWDNKNLCFCYNSFDMHASHCWGLTDSAVNGKIDSPRRNRSGTPRPPCNFPAVFTVLYFAQSWFTMSWTYSGHAVQFCLSPSNVFLCACWSSQRASDVARCCSAFFSVRLASSRSREK